MSERCYDCGCLIDDDELVRRNVAVSSTYIPSDGGPNHHGRFVTTYARVSLCRACNAARVRANAITFLVILGVVLGAVGWYQNRQPDAMTTKGELQDSPKVEQAARPPEAALPPGSVAIHSETLAPPPRRLDVAPSPRAWTFSLPATGYTSGWKKIGVVEARIAGVAVMRVPLVDKASCTFDSPKPVLTVWIEVRTEAITRKVELRHWQTFGEDCRLIDANGVTFDWARFGMGVGLQTGLPHLQVVQATGKSCFDVMVFAVPGRESGDLLLSLNAERVGEIGTFVFLLPATAIKP